MKLCCYIEKCQMVDEHKNQQRRTRKHCESIYAVASVNSDVIKHPLKSDQSPIPRCTTAGQHETPGEIWARIKALDSSSSNEHVSSSSQTRLNSWRPRDNSLTHRKSLIRTGIALFHSKIVSEDNLTSVWRLPVASSRRRHARRTL